MLFLQLVDLKLELLAMVFFLLLLLDSCQYGWRQARGGSRRRKWVVWQTMVLWMVLWMEALLHVLLLGMMMMKGWVLRWGVMGEAWIVAVYGWMGRWGERVMLLL